MSTNNNTSEGKKPLVLTQEGPGGIRYDFTEGCRVWVLKGRSGPLV